MRALIRKQRFPKGQRSFPTGPFGRMRAALTIRKGFFIRRDQTSAGTTFNRHIAHGHPAFHRQIANSLTAIFDHIACSTSGSGCADNREGNVFRRHARAQFPGDFYFHIF